MTYIFLFNFNFIFFNHETVIFLGKAKRLKQAKDEATDEIERYRGEREKQFKDFENKVSLKIILASDWIN